MNKLLITKKVLLLLTLPIIFGGVFGVYVHHAHAVQIIDADGGGGGGGGGGCGAISGACAAAHYTCTSGTQIGAAASATQWTWSCAGSCGGTTAACAENIPPMTASLSFNANPSAIGNQVLVSWSSTNAASCTVLKDNTTGTVIGTGLSGSVWSVPLTTNTIFAITCNNTAGTLSQSWTATVTMIPPPTAVISNTWGGSAGCYGCGTAISWSSANATSCNVTANGVGWATGVSGVSVPTGPLYQDYTFTVVCSGPSGSASYSVLSPVLPGRSALANSPVPYGTNSTISWTSTNSSGCVMRRDSTVGAIIGSGAVGSISYGPLYADLIGYLICNNASGSVVGAVWGPWGVNVAPSVTLSAATNPVAYGNSTTLSWTTAYATSCSLNRDGVVTAVPINSTNYAIGPLYSTASFLLTCTSASGTQYTNGGWYQVVVPPVNGVCAATAYGCAVGTSANNVWTLATGTYTWNCLGANGGTSPACSQTLVPAVAVTPHSAYGGTSGAAYVGEAVTLSWTASYTPSSCTVYRNGVLAANLLGSAVSYVAAALPEGNTTFRVDCANAGGTGTGNTVTFVVPVSSTGLTVSCPNPGTTAYFSYTLPAGFTRTVVRYYTTPPSVPDYNAACNPAKTPPNGQCSTITVGPSTSYATTPGVQYEWYVHTIDAYGNWSNAVDGGVFTCALPAVCGATNNACSAGTTSDIPDSGTQYLWNCLGLNGGANAACAVNKPVPNNPTIGGQLSPIINTSYPYTFQAADPMGQNVVYNIDWNNDNIVDQVSVAGLSNWLFTQNNNWPSAGVKTFKAYTSSVDGRSSGWTVYNVTVPIPVNGACNNTIINACTAGAFTDLVDDANNNLWYCAGANGGTNSLTCSFPKTNGVCSTTVINGCTSGTYVGTPASDAVNNNWHCAGANNGVDSPTCSIAKINGVCSATHYGCTAGTSVLNVSGPLQWTWTCNGVNNGTNIGCAEVKPAPNVPTISGPTQGQINTSYSFSFQATNPSGDPIIYAIDWTNTGTTVGNQYLPATGTTTQGTLLSATNNWAGPGVKYFKARTETNGGPVSAWATYAITIYGVPVVTWTPGAAATIPYNGTLSFGYTSTDASSCSYYDLNPSTGAVLSTIWLNGATSSSWVNPALYQSDFRRKVVCQNPFAQTGSAEFYVTVQQNNAACGTITVPSYIVPGAAFTATTTMLNTGTNPWTTTLAANYFLATSSSPWGISSVSPTVATVGAGGTGTFVAALTAPLIAGDYSFAWQMQPQFNSVWANAFGAVCTPTTPNSNLIRVKAPLLTVLPANYGFPDQVAGDPATTLLLHVANLGGGSILGGNITGFSGPFTCTTSCNFTLGPGEAKDIAISFAPTSTGAFGTTLHVNATSQTTVDVATYGNGVQKLVVSMNPTATVSTNPLDFGESATTRAKYLNFVIKNQSLIQSGGTVASIIPTNAVFTCVSGCSFTLPPSSSSTASVQTIRLKYIPTVVGPSTGQAVIGTTPPVTVDLIGVGVKPAFTTKEK